MRDIITLVGYAAAGILVGCGFLFPETATSAVCGLAGAAPLVAMCRARTSLRGVFVFGFFLSAFGFYWIPYTIKTFGGFSSGMASLLYALFCVANALQFVLFGVLYRRLRATVLEDFSLALPFSWLAAWQLFPAIFPWNFSHTLIVVQPFAMLAQLFGMATLDVFLLIWVEIVLRVMSSMRRGELELRLPLLISSASFVLLLVGTSLGGSLRDELARAPKVTVGLIQGNLEAHQKGDISYLEANLAAYRRLSDTAVREGASLLFWPETVMNAWIPENAHTVADQKYDPWPARVVPLMFGALSYRMPPASVAPTDENISRFNSAFAIDPMGQVTGKFHKRVLMPFGEYLPFASVFPFLRALSPHTGNFAFGDLSGPVEMLAQEGKNLLRIPVQPLICYEDIVSSVADAGALAGAAFLVNLTNDAWYGVSKAPYQHHLLAMGRAVETKRYLLRVTNTGLTGVVNPLGQTEATLPIFTEGVLVRSIPLLSGPTTAAQLGGRQNWLISIFAMVFFFLRRRSALAESTSSSKNRRM
ncbi:MAG: apolipoprotein N-acyltransferase [Deltaproteobacteria bacterium]|nr:apolipoprotein N-acyltransferase [Deltaproteobacteria bacterium]